MTAAVVTDSLTSAVSASTNTLTAAKPTGVVSGDVLGALMYFRNATASPGAPSGWTLASPVGAHFGLALYVKPVPDAALESAADYTFTANATGRSGLAVFRITGANVTTPVDVTGATQETAQAGSLGVLTPSATTTQPDVLLLDVAAHNLVSVTAVPVTPDPAMTEAYELHIESSSSSTLEFAYQTWPTAGATGTRNPTWPTPSSSCASFLVGIAPTAVVPPSTSGGWVAEGAGVTLSLNTATPLAGTTSLRAVKTFGAGLTTLRINDNGQLHGSLASFGDTFSTRVKVTASGGSGWQIRMETRDSSLTWQPGGWWPVTPGTAFDLLHTVYGPYMADVTGIGFHLEASGVSGSVTLDVDTVVQGNYAGATAGLQAYKNVSQAAVNAIRANADTKRVYVPGYAWAAAKDFAATNGAPWVTGGGDIGYEAHLYYDDDRSGTYAASYDTEVTNAAGQGYASPAARAAAWLADYTSWLVTNGVSGFLGETGWPDTDTRWNDVGATVLTAVHNLPIDAAVWVAAELYGTSNPLAVYEDTGGPAGLDAANVQATVLESFLPPPVVPPAPTPVPGPTPGPTPGPPKPAGWAWVVGPWNSGPDTLLSGARNRRVVWRRVGRSEASFDIDGDDPAAAQIDEMIDDLWVIRIPTPGTGRTLFRGRVGPTGDDRPAGSDTHTVTVSAGDYRAVLDRRVLWEGGQTSWVNGDQSAILWGLVGRTQSQPGGNLGIVRGVGQTTGVVRVRNDYPAGKSIGEAADQLSQVENGFDYQVRPDVDPRNLTLYLDVWYPSIGQDRGVVLDYGGRLAGFRRQVDPGQYANAIRGTGADSTSTGGTLAPVRREAADIATRPEGRWDGEMADPDLVVAQTIVERTVRELAVRQVVTPSWSVTLSPDGWGGPDDVWLGDPVTLVVKSGRLNVVESLQVQEISCTWDDGDTVTTTLELGAVEHPGRRWSLRKIDQRLRSLERR